MLKTTINKQSNGSSMNFSPLNNNLGKYLLQAFALFCLLSSLAIAKTTQSEYGSRNVIQNIEYSTLPGNRLQISLELS